VLVQEAIEPPIHSLNLSDTDNGADGRSSCWLPAQMDH
jgi:hypothetical protein